MKNFFKQGLLIFATSITLPVVAQLQVQSGATLYLGGNAQVTLQDVSLVNDGTITVASNGRFIFSGIANSQLSGSQQPAFNELEIAKSGSNKLILQRSIDVSGKIIFTSGLIDLGNYNILLGTSALLESENENSRAMTTGTGYIQAVRVLNAPLNNNPAGLGVLITTSQNLGTTTVRRGHKSQVNSFGNGNSILRYYDIIPTNNTSLNATLRFNYFDAELNGLTENTMVFWRSTNNINWTNEGFTSRNTASNYVEKTGINAFSRWTLSSPFNALPLLFTFFNVKCENDKVIVSWKTTQEQNTSRFNIERSANGNDWVVIGSMPAAGNSSFERSYAFIDSRPLPNSYYRVAEIDLDGSIHFSKILLARCNEQEQFKVWPNPVKDALAIQIDTRSSANVDITVYDGKGALVKKQQFLVMPGSNLLSMDLKELSPGGYVLSADWTNGILKKQILLIKQ